MRKLLVFNLITLDGFFEGPGQSIDWHNVDAEFNEFALAQLAELDVIIFGRVTYEGMANFWPAPFAIENDPLIAARMNSFSKIVISRTLDKVEWNNTRLIKDNIAYEITRLKGQPGKDLAIFGSANLAASLLQLGLIDEIRVIVNPLLLGKGTPLFQNIPQPIKLKLLKTHVFGNGNVLLCYQIVTLPQL